MPHSLLENLTSLFSSARVLVVGDMMLDRYWFGDVTRISPEAPVPVAKISRIDQRAGGSGNVARNIASLGGQVALISAIGDDEAGKELEGIIRENGISGFLQRDKNMSTTLKLRVLSRNQQLIRLDFEATPQPETLDRLYQQYRSLLPDYDTVIISDYGKGCLNRVPDMIDSARDLGKPVLIDPKGSDYDKYAGATLLTPNRSELREVIGTWHSESELADKVQTLRRRLQLNALLLTRSEEGMSLYESEHISHQPTRAQEVYDVSGAGDTVIAAMGLALAARLDLRRAMHIANAAAGVVVAKLGTAVCSQPELLSALQQELPDSTE